MAIILKENPNPPRPIVALTLDGEFVNRFDSIKDASAELRLGARNISEHLNGRTCRVGDYIFKDLDKYDCRIKYTYAALKRRKQFLKRK